jgi:uncharacterized repeat protein (TIGR03803 family)
MNEPLARLRILVMAVMVLVAVPAATMAQSAYTVLHAFNGGADGADPQAALIQATDGNFYGTTGGGGASNAGTVFTMTPAGAVTVLHAFAGGADGASPLASLIQGTDGNFYGTTASGGDSSCNSTYAGGCGTIFKMTPAGTVTVLHAFSGGTDGAYPWASLIQATDGDFYGTTQSGGGVAGCFLGCGTVFKMTPAGTVTVLHAFAGGADGAYPTAALIQATDGNLYGTANAGGGVNNSGIVFTMTPAGTVTVLHAFARGTDGANPSSALILASDGNFYGTVYQGGISGFGAVFKMTPSGAFTVLHAFGNAPDGAYPRASLIQAADGNFYGTTSDDYPAHQATIFAMTPGGTVTVLHAFASTIDGGGDVASVIQATNGNFYGTSNDAVGKGAVFELSLGAALAITTQPANQAIVSGGTATLTVVASGIGLTYQWYMGVAGATTSPISGATASSYTTPPLTGRTSYWVRVSNNTAAADSNTATVSIAIVPGDFDGDRKTDIAIYRPSTGTWYVLESSSGFTGGVAYAWGASGDVTVPGDYDGDGQADIGVYRPSTGHWYILLSSANYARYVSYEWGLPADTPVPGDYDGDGKTDVAMYRPATGAWYILLSSANYYRYVSYEWGVSTDTPVPGDYDGDGKTDVAVYRPATGNWFILKSSTNNAMWDTYQWGTTGDILVPADYDGDGKTDVAVYRPSTGTWYIRRSSTGAQATYAWGASGDVPVPGDYDGDGKTDIVIYRPSDGSWFILKSSTNYSTWEAHQWGGTGDMPLLKGR